MTLMVHWTKWIVPGLITVAVLSFLAVRFEAAQIQADLTSKAEQALVEEKLSWAKVTLNGRDAAISGAAPTESDRERAREVVAETYDIRVVSDETDLIALQDPYVITAQKADGRIELSGFIPTEGKRAIVVDAAKAAFPDSEVEDRTTLARGAPDGFDGLTFFALAQLAKLSTGEVTLSGPELSISGTAKDRISYDEILALPDATERSGAEIGELNITPPPESPYRWSVELAQAAVTATGFVASEEQRELLAQSAKRALPETDYLDNTLLASNSPSGFGERLNFAVTQLGRFEAGSVSFEDDRLQIRGQARSLQAFDELNTALRNLPTGVILARSDILPPLVEPYVWQGVVAEDGAKISGFVPDENARTVLSRRLKELRPELAVTDDTRLAMGNPSSYGEAMVYAAERLAQLESGSVTLEGEEVSVSGVARSSQTFLDAVSTDASAPPEPYRLVANDVVAPVQSDWSWGVRYDGQLVDVTGYVANNADRSEILFSLAAALPEAKLVDGMQLGSGAPENDKLHRAFTIRLLRHLASAEMALDDGTLGVVGVAKSRAGFRAVTKALDGDLPEGLTSSRVEIAPAVQSPHVWSAKRDTNRLVLSGDLASEATRADLLQQVGRTFGVNVADSMQLASGAPEQRLAARNFALGILAQMSSGTVILSDQDLSVMGVAADLGSYDALKTKLAETLPAGLELMVAEIVPPTIKSFRWSAELEDSVVTVSGFVPDDATRIALVEEGRRVFPQNRIVDRMRVAAGAPPDFGDVTLKSIADLRRLSKGQLSYEDGNRRISGIAKSSADFLFLQRKIETDAKLSGVVMPPLATGSYDWQAAKTSGSIVLSGLVPSEADRQRISERLKATNRDQSIIDRTLLAGGEGLTHLKNVDRVVDVLAGLSAGTVGISDQKISIDGTATSVDRYDELTAKTKMWVSDEAILIGRIDILPPVISPFTWRITETNQEVTLSGFAPTPDIAADLAAAASSQLRATVTDDQRIAGGEPDGFGRTARILIDALDRAQDVTASLTNGRIVLQGKANSESEAFAIGERIGGLLSADYKLENRLSFPLPAPVVVAKPAAAPATEPSEPEQRETLATDGSDVPVTEDSSTQPNSSVAEIAAQPIEDVPEPAIEEVSAACPVDFQAILRGQKILFDNNRAFIKTSSYPLLDRLADGFGKCSDARVEITGHTDDVGRDAYNLSLSQSRAEAVVDYIAGKGVDIDSFKAKGLGETQPIQDNATEVGRAANRRIVIEVFPNPE